MDRDQERAIEWDCFHTQNRYYVLVDAGDYEGGANLFTEDAVWTLWGQELHGRAEILKGLEDGLGPVFIRHYVSNITVNVIDENNAEVISYVHIYRHEWDEIKDGTIPTIGAWVLGRHDNKMVRTDEGWRISRRDISSFLRRP
jgi:ketosteroid isomerase-like protein